MKRFIICATALLVSLVANAGSPKLDIPKETSNEIFVVSAACRAAYQDEGLKVYWNSRRESLVNAILKQNPSIILIQEAEWGQMLYLDDMFPGFARAAFPNVEEKEKSEYVIVYYKESDFELVDSGHFWLSPTPDEISVGWNAAQTPRDATWAVLKDKFTERDILVCSAHLEYARKFISHALPLLQNRLHAISQYKMPIIVGGPFFVEENDELLKNFYRDYQDAVIDCESTGSGKTYNDFGARSFNSDHILYRGFKGDKYSLVTTRNSDGGYISDHYPMSVKLSY